jgi:hypothetical protein
MTTARINQVPIVARAARPRGRGRPGCPPQGGGWMGDAGGGAPEARPGPAAPAGSRSAREALRAIPIAPTVFLKGGSAAGAEAPPRDGEAGRCGMPRSGGGCRPPGTPSPRGKGRGRAGTAPQGAAGNRWRAANGPRRPSGPGGGSPGRSEPQRRRAHPTTRPEGDDAGGGRRPAGRGSPPGPEPASWGRPKGPAATRPHGGGSVKHGTGYTTTH